MVLCARKASDAASRPGEGEPQSRADVLRSPKNVSAASGAGPTVSRELIGFSAEKEEKVRRGEKKGKLLAAMP